nr:uncharacterized protein C9orf50 homolog isoform X3 [Equus caballus]
MPRRHPKPGAQWVAPKGFPGEGDGARRRRPPLLPRLPPPELRASWGADGLGGSRASGGGAGWWQTPRGQASPAAPGEGVRSPPPRLPALPTVAPRAAQDRTGLRSLLLPPLFLARAARAPAPPRPEPRECEDPRRGPAKEAADSLGALLGEFLPGRFREFLRRLGVERAEQPRPRTSSAAQHQRSVSERCQRCPCCPRASFLPDLQGKSSFIRNSLKKILLHQIPALGTSKRDHLQFTTIKKASHSSEEGSGHCRRCSPFRVRFADETLRDTALRYWERSCAASSSPRASNSQSTACIHLPSAYCMQCQEIAAPKPGCGPAGQPQERDGHPVVGIRVGVREPGEMAGESAQRPVLQRQGGGRGRLPIQLELPLPVHPGAAGPPL